tara:strand:+ start:342 stop:584 length:243 start_codon:yes stop_codon:yes gene_type:complete
VTYQRKLLKLIHEYCFAIENDLRTNDYEEAFTRSGSLQALARSVDQWLFAQIQYQDPGKAVGLPKENQLDEAIQLMEEKH